jgi:hypothetical protein
VQLFPLKSFGIIKSNSQKRRSADFDLNNELGDKAHPFLSFLTPRAIASEVKGVSYVALSKDEAIWPLRD